MNKHSEELEHNALVDWLEAKFGHLRPHAGKIAFFAAALVAIGVMLAFYLRARNEVFASQWERLNMALTQRNLDGQTRQFTDYADEFPDEQASLWAWQFAADGELGSGLRMLISQWDEGRRRLERAKSLYRRVLESSLKKSPLLLERANYGLAYSLEALGEFDAAKEQYQKIIDEVPKSAFAKAAADAIQRLSNPEWIAFHDNFYKIGIAPGLVLPSRPDISFPDIDAPAAPTEGENAEKSDGDDQQNQRQDESEESGDDETDDDTKGDDRTNDGTVGGGDGADEPSC